MVTSDTEFAPRLNRASLGRQIADAVRDEILFGRIPPGASLTQQELCDRFGTSRMPVRDALRELMHAGLVVSDDAGHTVVAPLKRSDLRDTYRIQGMLHGLATRLAAEKATDAELEDLAAMHRAMVAAEEDQDIDTMTTVNHSFHRKINLLANSPRLLTVLKTLSAQIPRHYAPEMPAWMRRANAEHTDVVEAMTSRDADRAAELMEEHVATAVEDLIAFLEHKQFAFSDD